MFVLNLEPLVLESIKGFFNIYIQVKFQKKHNQGSLN